MLKKYFTVALIAGLSNLLLVSTGLGYTNNEEKRAAKEQKVKAGIAKLGTGSNAKVKVKLYDNTKLSGYVSEIKEDAFVVVNANTNSPTEIPYSKVKQVQGNNLSRTAKIAIGVGIILAIGIFFALQTD